MSGININSFEWNVDLIFINDKLYYINDNPGKTIGNPAQHNNKR